MPQEVEHDVVEGPCSCGAWHKPQSNRIVGNTPVGVYHEATGGLYPGVGYIGQNVPDCLGNQTERYGPRELSREAEIQRVVAMQATHEAQVEGLRMRLSNEEAAHDATRRERDEWRDEAEDTRGDVAIARAQRDEATEGELARAVERDEALKELERVTQDRSKWYGKSLELDAALEQLSAQNPSFSMLQAKLRATEAELSRANAALEPLVLRDLPALERRFAAVVTNRDEILATLDAVRAECTKQTERIRELSHGLLNHVSVVLK